MKAYKGFNKDMTCRGLQFEIGKEYEEECASLCHSGFHACENPIDVLRYYSPTESVYHEVELDEVSNEREKDSKVCARKIKVGAELKLADMIKLGVQVDIQSTKRKCKTSGYSSPAATSGNYSPAATSGYYSHAATSGKHSIAAAIGRYSMAKSTVGNWIVVSEYGKWDGECHPVLCVKAAQIDGETLKADTWYRLENGEFVEVENNA